MSAVKTKWREYSAKYAALSKREKVMVAAAGLVVIVMVFSMLIIEPRYQLIDKVSASNKRLVNANNEQKSLHAEIEAKLAQNPNDLVRAQLQDYQSRLDEIDTKLTELTKHLISPAQMRSALTQLLKLEQDVKLVSVQSLPVQPLVSQEKPEEATDSDASSSEKTEQAANLNSSENTTAVLYKHEIKLTLRGDYQALKRYLTLVEDLPWRFYWQSFEFSVKEHPKAELELHLFSLSTQKDFIGV